MKKKKTFPRCLDPQTVHAWNLFRKMRSQRDYIIGSPLKSILACFHAPKEPVHDKLEQQDQILILFISKYEDINKKMNH